MRFMMIISDLIVPMIFVFVIFYGYSKKVDLFNAFTEGCVDGFKTVYQILPTLIGLMVAVGVLRSSGTLELLCDLLKPMCKVINFPVETLPLTLMRLVSSSASTGLLLDIFKTYGPDSYIGRFVSVMMSCTETVFYTMSVYFMSVRITKTRYTLAGALIANVAGVAASLFITNLLWST